MSVRVSFAGREVLQDLKKRGLSQNPHLGISDGPLGFWAALEEELSSCRHQRCWVHKTANVLDKVSNSRNIHASDPREGIEEFQKFYCSL